MSGRDADALSRDRHVVLFVSLLPYLGGGQVSLLTLLRFLPSDVTPVLAAPEPGPLIDRVKADGRVREHVVIPRTEHSGFPARVNAVVTLGRWLVANRHRVRAIHANGEAEAKLLLPLLVLLPSTRVVVWHHSKQTSCSTVRMAPLWRLLRRRVRWAPVSEASRNELAAARIASSADMTVVPNPIDPAAVVPPSRPDRDSLPYVVGYLGCEEISKGFLQLPAIAEHLGRDPIQLLVVTKGRPRSRNSESVNEALDRLQALEPHVRFRSHDPDVKNIYADVDAVLVPSLAESFCRIAAEAMMNRLPVVASDLPALRELLAGVDAELLFRVGDVDTAAGAIRRVASDPDVQARVAERAARRVAAFTPDHVVEKLLQLYGLTR